MTTTPNQIPEKKPRLVKTEVALVSQKIPVYAGKKVADALKEVSKNMDVYKGVKFAQILEAVYEQGKKDGARIVKEGFETLMIDIPHATPGRPKKRRG